MTQKSGFTTGSISGDLNAKFGQDRAVFQFVGSVYLWVFIASLPVAVIATLYFALPAMGWAIAVLGIDPESISRQLQLVASMFS